MDKVQKKLLRDSLAHQSDEFWPLLNQVVLKAGCLNELILAASYTKKARKLGMCASRPAGKAIKLALIGGYTFSPLSDCLKVLLAASGFSTEIFEGEYNNYIPEILNPGSQLYTCNPDYSIFLPSSRHARYHGSLADPHESQKNQAQSRVKELLELIEKIHQGTGKDLIFTNFRLTGDADTGHCRSKLPGSEYSFAKYVNLELGLNAPGYAHICDAEFLANRMGASKAEDFRFWYESKQMGSMDFIFYIVKEIAHLIRFLTSTPKKVIVLDLDNTLWGGVIGDDGLSNIELGDTSARGEAFKDFQKYLKSLMDRGYLLAVCSKNNQETAKSAFEQHPEMVLSLDDIVSFKANWNSKADNIDEIARELNLGLQSFVFVDDNPAEIEMVNQFLPEVSTLCLGTDPSTFVSALKNSRLLDTKTITAEDRRKTTMYKTEARRSNLKKSITDIDSYLKSLAMKAKLSPFTELDVPRISQLINKSNQFNLTTVRRSEAEVRALMQNPSYRCFSVRLEDKFGDYGLISIVICEVRERRLHIDTLLMSCRVLERQVEHEVMNHIHRVAKDVSAQEIVGSYLPTKKNKLVENLYTRLGFETMQKDEKKTVYKLPTWGYKPIRTHIQIEAADS